MTGLGRLKGIPRFWLESKTLTVEVPSNDRGCALFLASLNAAPEPAASFWCLLVQKLVAMDGEVGVAAHGAPNGAPVALPQAACCT